MWGGVSGSRKLTIYIIITYTTSLSLSLYLSHLVTSLYLIIFSVISVRLLSSADESCYSNYDVHYYFSNISLHYLQFITIILSILHNPS